MLMRIGGADAASPDDAWIDVKNPATGEQIDRVPAGSADDVSRAVDAAGAAADGWKKKTFRERGIILFHAAGQVREQHRELARLLTAEQGKPLRESVDEVRGFANILEFYAGISAAQQGEMVRLGAAGDALVAREPLGVCGAIIPWNMPVLIMGWKVGPALLAGNTMVLKPASTTPLATTPARTDPRGRTPPARRPQYRYRAGGGRRGSAGETPGGPEDLLHRELRDRPEDSRAGCGPSQGTDARTRGLGPDDRDGRCGDR